MPAAFGSAGRTRESRRANLDFFIGLRNKVEHRFARDHAALAAAVSGQAQARLLNYEKELTDQFGIASSLATRLRFPVFIGSFTGEGEKALLQLRKRLPASLRKFLAEYHAKLGSAVKMTPAINSGYEPPGVRPQGPGPSRDPVHPPRRFDREERDTVEQLGRKGHVIIRERLRNVAGADELSPRQVVAAVQARVPYRFTTDDFQRAWKTLQVRPATGAADPERTDERYCTYYTRHRDYGYRPAYVEKLAPQCARTTGFTRLTGKPARDKVNRRVGRGPDDRGDPADSKGEHTGSAARRRLHETSRMHANSGRSATDRPPVPRALQGDRYADLRRGCLNER